MAPIRDEAAELDAEFSRLYRTYAHDLRRFAVYLSGDPALADDMVSEAFARAWTTRDRLEFSTVRGYLFAIVRNLFLQHQRRAWRRQPLDEQMIPGVADRQLARTYRGPPRRGGAVGNLRGAATSLAVTRAVEAWFAQAACAYSPRNGSFPRVTNRPPPGSPMPGGRRWRSGRMLPGRSASRS